MLLQDDVRTPAIEPGFQPPMTGKRARAKLASDAGAACRWTVTVHEATGKLHSKTPLGSAGLSIGRSTDCDIALQSKAVSRLHGRLRVNADGGVIYEDENSANGSVVDGRPVVGAIALGTGACVVIGGFRVSLEQAEAAAGPDALDQTTPLSAAELMRMAQPPEQAARPPPVAEVEKKAKSGRAGIFKSPLAGLEFRIPDVPAATACIGQVQHDNLGDSMKHLLDQQIRGIQSRRHEQEQQSRSEREQFELAWREALTAARELQGRIGRNPRVLYYVVTRDSREVSVKILEDSRKGYSNLILSRRHPETGLLQDGRIWFGVMGEEPKSYREPREALEEFVRRIASKLA